MNLLPFVFTFLLLLTLISSFLFSSVLGTARESRVISLQHDAYLQLLSDQNLASFKPHKKETKNPDPTKPKNKTESTKKNNKEPRSQKTGLEKSKLNIYKMIQGNDPHLQKVLEETAVRLIDTVYGSCSFYKPNFAQTIVKQMIDQKIETLEELDLEKDKLDEVYYKMLKGTNTGYPSLTEYVRIIKDDKQPIYYRYASKTVLQALIGEENAKNLFILEKKKWQENNKCQALTNKEFNEFYKAKPSSHVPQNLIGILLNFEIKDKGLVQVYQDEKEKIRAVHTVENKD